MSSLVLILLLAASAHANLKHRIVDPLGKYSIAQIESIAKCYEDWNNEERYPKVILTVKQWAWFYSLGCANMTGQGPQAEHHEYEHWHKNTRREYRLLSDMERSRLHDAFNSMKNSYPDHTDWRSEYDIIVELHRRTMAPGAHEGPGFLVWHREYLWRMEQALKMHDPEISLPYYDTTLDQPLPEPRESVIWTDKMMGNNDGVVRSGPFAGWPATRACYDIGKTLTRDAALNPNASVLLFSDADIEYVLAKRAYEEIVAPLDSKFEDDHAGVHTYIGGHMSTITCSPNDPIFWMHHAYIDCVWEDFRQFSQVTWPEKEYPMGPEIEPEHRAYTYMEPFKPIYNIHGLSNHYTNYYYRCASRPERCKWNDDCHSEHLWCDKSIYRCKSKIVKRGSCANLPDDACSGSLRCIEGICKESHYEIPDRRQHGRPYGYGYRFYNN